jgi:hypothetical protein
MQDARGDPTQTDCVNRESRLGFGAGVANAPKREAGYDRDASQEGAGIYRLSTALAVSGDLSAAQRKELCRVARREKPRGL